MSNEDDHLEWIVTNNKMLRKLGAFQTYYDALRIACSKYATYLLEAERLAAAAGLPAPSVARLPNEPNIAVEIEALVTLLYMLVVSHEDDFEFMGELGERHRKMEHSQRINSHHNCA